MALMSLRVLLVAGVLGCFTCNPVLQPEGSNDEKVAVMNQLGNSRSSVDAGCAFCEYFMGKIDAALDAEGAGIIAKLNATIYPACMAEINQSSVCIILSETLELAYHEIMKELDPHTVCLKAGFCKQGISYSKNDVEELMKREYKGLLCDICEEIAKVVDKFIFQAFAKLQVYLNNFCHRIPPPDDKWCLQLVVKIMQAVEAKVTDFVKPLALCTKVHAC